MSSPDIVAENELRHQLVLGGKNYGYFNGEEVELSSEVNEEWDPEYGLVFSGSKQTGDDLKLERPLERGRDLPVHRELEPLRGRIEGHVALFVFDAYDQPVSSEPVRVYPCRLVSVTKPASSDSGDSGKLKVTVKIR